MDPVANGRSQREHRGHCGRTQHYRHPGKRFPTPLTHEALHQKPEEHHFSNTPVIARRSEAAIVTMPPATVDFSGIGLHPPACPIEAAFKGEAHILHVIPWLPI